MAKTFKPIHSRTEDSNLKSEIKKDALLQAKNLLESFQPQKKIRGGSQNFNVVRVQSLTHTIIFSWKKRL